MVVLDAVHGFLLYCAGQMSCLSESSVSGSGQPSFHFLEISETEK